MMFFLGPAPGLSANPQDCSATLSEIATLDQINWVGNARPSEALFQNTARTLPKSLNPLTRGTTLYALLSFQSFKAAAASSSEIKVVGTHLTTSIARRPDVVQKIEANGEYEFSLLAHSGETTPPQEVLQFRVLSGKTAHFTGTVFRGTSNQVLAGRRHDEINLLLKRAAGSEHPIEEIELNHTHPMFQFVEVLAQPRPRFFITPLSNSDLALAVRYSIDYPEVVFTIKAITPGGFYYKTSFKNGRTL
ncbi:MAG TPA: hypothetical protein PLH57_10340 [Oligoflexia bacterium]|nr:hypothetical protein [Oligoflexia bacterium]